jgi:hypothetical protein
MKFTQNPQFTLEQEVLLWSIRVDHEQDQRISGILKAGVDWKYIRENAIRHGVIPLLYKRLKGEMAELIPSEERSVLSMLFQQNAIRNIQMTQHLLKVIDLFEKADIRSMPFKGPVLAVQAYGDLSMRSFGDLDILINIDDFSSAYTILIENGFLPEPLADSPLKKKLLIRLEKEQKFFYQNMVIEVHWNILEKVLSIPLDQDLLWSRAVAVFPFEREVRTLSPEDIVIISCIHGTKHFWSNLIWLADLAYIITQHPEIQWELVFDRSEKMGVLRIVLLGLFLAKEFCGLKYPPAIENRIDRDAIIPKLTDSSWINFFEYTGKDWSHKHPGFYLKSRERLRDRIIYISNVLMETILRSITPNYLDFNFISMPDLLFPLYLIIRPFRIFRDYCFFIYSVYEK